MPWSPGNDLNSIPAKTNNGRFLLRVIFGLGRAQLRGPLYPDEPTASGRFGRSEKCQKRKHWIEQLFFRLASWAVVTVRNGLDHPI
jgi:hypothetical protein